MRKKWIVLLVVLGCLVGAGTIYRVFFVWAVRVPTGSMMNTILIGDHLMVHRSFGDIQRGSVVMFQYPDDPERYLARVVGLPGEAVEVRGRSVYINGAELPEQRVMIVSEHLSEPLDKLEELSSEGSGPYKVFYTRREDFEGTESQPPHETPFASTGSPARLADREYFLLGDNRDNSEDSRYRGTVPRELIWGTVSVVYWSSFRDKTTQEEHIRFDRFFTKIK